jgi:hypothetical protein
MKVLLECQTAAYAKLAGLKNGDLLTAAEAAEFHELITTDQQIPFQQNLDGRRIAIICLCARTNRLVDVRLLTPSAPDALDAIEPGRVIRLGARL